MAICELCEGEMLEVDGCMSTVFKRNGATCPRIKYGDEPDDWGANCDYRCHDCNAAAGNYHHVNCDVERCPKCDDQLIRCDCFDDAEEVVIGQPGNGMLQ